MSTPGITLDARIVRRIPMHYATAADVSLDRPELVRAGSGLAWIDSRLAVVQDDANFVALVDPATGAADCITLPLGPGNRRQFADALGNKPDKFDFESIVHVQCGEDVLLVIGSGSSAQRERIVLIDPSQPARDASLHHLPDFYSQLRRTADFSGSDMNIEGAVQVGSMLRLFGRGNGLAGESLEAIDATCDVDVESFLAHVRAPHVNPPPLPVNIARFDLGTLRGMRLSFTDATLDPAEAPGQPRRVVYLAAAEDSPDATRDGEVTGSVVGVIHYEAGLPIARHAELRDEHGGPLHVKAEGIAFSQHDPSLAYVVLDVDAADQASELCEVRLSGMS